MFGTTYQHQKTGEQQVSSVRGRFLAGRNMVNLHIVISWAGLSSHFRYWLTVLFDLSGLPISSRMEECSLPPWFPCVQSEEPLSFHHPYPSLNLLPSGNCGCAFLQIDVGRSSWSLDRPFVTLLPATMLMSLADSKQGKNRSGVRMFKDGKESKSRNEKETEGERLWELQYSRGL